MTLLEVYEKLAADRPAEPALTYARPPVSAVLTWSGLLDRAASIADRMRQAGLSDGGRCAVVMVDDPDVLPTVLAVWRVGAVVVPIDSQWGGDTKRSVLALSGARLVADPSAGTCTATTAPTGRPALPAGTAMISYTSGSTSDPKGVVLSHGQLRHAYEAGGKALIELLGRRPERFGVTMRMSGLGILGMNYLWPAVLGIPVVVLPELTLTTARGYWSTLRAGGADVTYLVPPLVELLTRMGVDDDPDETVVCLSGGAPLSAGAHEAFQRQFRAVLLNVYGMTEVSFAAFFGDLDAAGRGTLSIGRPATVEARLRAPDGSIVGGAGEGELEMRGPAMSCGYYDNPSATRDLVPDGWVRSGDLARRDAEGRYRIVGRRKDVVLKGAFTIYLHEIEEAASALPGVLECAAVRIDLPTGEDVGLLVRLSAGAVVDPGAVRRELADMLGAQRAPRRVVVTSEALPRLGQEKIDRRAAKARWSTLTAG